MSCGSADEHSSRIKKQEHAVGKLQRSLFLLFIRSRILLDSRILGFYLCSLFVENQPRVRSLHQVPCQHPGQPHHPTLFRINSRRHRQLVGLWCTPAIWRVRSARSQPQFLGSITPRRVDVHVFGITIQSTPHIVTELTFGTSKSVPIKRKPAQGGVVRKSDVIVIAVSPESPTREL